MGLEAMSLPWEHKLRLSQKAKNFIWNKCQCAALKAQSIIARTFGLGSLAVVDKVRIKWPNGKVTELDSVKTNQTLTLYQKDGKAEGAKTEGSGRFLFQQQKQSNP